MTTSLSSDVPAGYFSWSEYDLMAPVQPKTESALAAAFISNCGARNFRLQALIALENANIKIGSYGGCHRNRDGRGDLIKDGDCSLTLYMKLFFILLYAKSCQFYICQYKKEVSISGEYSFCKSFHDFIDVLLFSLGFFLHQQTSTR